MDDLWRPLGDELQAWRAAGREVRLWLRDDDAAEPTPALDRLLSVTTEAGVPCLLAVIPGRATAALARSLRSAAHVGVAQHGYVHANHAPVGAKAAELGDDRPPETVLADIAEGRRRMDDLFGTTPVLVPPWNRIAPPVMARLPALGFTGLSTFGWRTLPPPAGLRQVNCHLDIIDWKGSRQGHSAPKLVGDFAEALAEARRAGGAPVGILTHHLVHGAAAWTFLDALFRRTVGHPGVRWCAFDTLTQG